MRRVLLTFVAGAALLLMATPVFGSEPPVTRHLHILTTPNGTSHAIARGLTFHAPCTAFLNFHEIVHETVFGTPATGALKNPNGPLAAQPQPALGACTPDP
jgi:hypothetical protein